MTMPCKQRRVVGRHARLAGREIKTDAARPIAITTSSPLILWLLALRLFSSLSLSLSLPTSPYHKSGKEKAAAAAAAASSLTDEEKNGLFIQKYKRDRKGKNGDEICVCTCRRSREGGRAINFCD